MLTTLLKYEGKATARVMLPVGGGVLVFTLITGLLNAVLNSQSHTPDMVDFAQAMLNLVAILALVFVAGVCVFVNVQRFYKLLGEQGYLMLSLPVSTWKHMAAKLICACGWSVVTVVYLMLCGGILGGSFWGTATSLEAIHLPLDPAGVALAGMMLLMMLALLAGAYLDFYLACAIGGQFGQQRLLASIVTYFVLGFVEQVLGMFLLILVAFGVIQTNATGWMSLFYNVDAFWATVYLISVVLIVALVVDAVKWAVTQWLMTRRLNLT